MSRILRSSLGLAVVATAAVGLVGSGAGAAVSAPRPHVSLASTPKLNVTISKKNFKVSGPTTFSAGRVALSLTAVGGERLMDIVSFKNGYTFKHFRSDLAAFGASEGPMGASKSGLKHLNNAVKHLNIYGGLDNLPGSKLTGTVTLPKAGSYTIFNDGGNLPTDPKVLTVTGPAVKRAKPHSTATAKATSAKRFGGAATLPAKGTITFKNVSTNSPHYLNLQHVKEGTTRKQVIAYLNSGSQAQPSFGLQGQANTDVLGEGQTETLTYNVPKGEYVEMCFFPDLKTGIPHALMGMVRVVHLT
jgi:hypothetical protein